MCNDALQSEWLQGLCSATCASAPTSAKRDSCPRPCLTLQQRPNFITFRWQWRQTPLLLLTLQTSMREGKAAAGFLPLHSRRSQPLRCNRFAFVYATSGTHSPWCPHAGLSPFGAAIYEQAGGSAPQRPDEGSGPSPLPPSVPPGVEPARPGLRCCGRRRARPSYNPAALPAPSQRLPLRLPSALRAMARRLSPAS